jgi:PAS domain S-box-containing protein
MYIIAPLPIRMLVSVPDGTPSWLILVCYANDVLKGLLSASLLLRGADVGAWFNHLRGFIKYLLVAVTLSPALSALGAAVFLMPFWPNWTQWFLGNALASLVLTPALYCAVKEVPRIRRATLNRKIEFFILATGLVLCSYVTFDLNWNQVTNWGFLLYLPMPFLIWGALRFNPLATSASLFVMSAMATFGALAGTGPFTATASEFEVRSIQLFLLLPSVGLMFLAVLRQQQYQTHSALRESEQRFRLLVDTAPVMVWMSDSEGNCTFVNKPWLSFTGMPLEHHVGGGWLENIYPEDRDRVVHAAFAAFHERKSLILEYRLRRFDGAYRWMLDTSIPRYGPEKDFLGYLGSCVDITHQKEAEEKLRRLPRELLNAQEAERQRIGQELHDDLGQRVVALSIGITSLSRRINGDEQTGAVFASLRQQASDIVKDIARISHYLRPSVLQSMGLPIALQTLCEKSRDPNGMNVVFTHSGEFPERVPWHCSIALYRVAQEALRNALTHSGSEEVCIDLSTTASELVVMISDDGRGFDINSASTGLGLSGMAERMRDIHGTLRIESIPGNGTTITAAVSLQVPAEAKTDSAVR